MSLRDVTATIAKACAEFKRPASAVTLVAVSKQQSEAAIIDVLHQRQRVFGENRVQEAHAHWQNLRTQYPDIQLHLIGHLQTNKAADAVALFDVIETVDSEKLARALADEMKKQNRHLPCFIQVNTGDEPQKGGVSVAELPALLAVCRDIGLNVTGLMCIPPVDDVPGLHFALLHKLATLHGLQHLSMGMSGDYPVAISYGATHVRVGSAIFGARDAA